MSSERIESVNLGPTITRSDVRKHLEENFDDNDPELLEERIDRVLYFIQQQVKMTSENTDLKDDALDWGIMKMEEEEEQEE